jgi:hypothetical protein
MFDLNSGGHADCKNDAWRRIATNADPYGLGNSHPGEDGVDVGDFLECLGEHSPR